MLFKNKSIEEIQKTYKIAKKKFKENKNVQLYLKSKNYGEIERIKLSYDVQSGTYIKFTKSMSKKKKEKVYLPLIKVIKAEFPNIKSILDFGCGELDTSLFVFNNLKYKIKKYFACDLSLNRLVVGQKFIKKELKKKEFNKINIFCNSDFNLPFKDNSLDLIITIHSLESNNRNKELFIKELIRVSKKGIILMEPHYEISTKKQKKRMNKFNYIKGLERIFKKNRYKYKIIKKNFHTKQTNISSFFIIKKNKNVKNNENYYVEPKTLSKFLNIKSFLYSKKSLRLYPVFNKIPLFSDESQFFLPSLKL